MSCKWVYIIGFYQWRLQILHKEFHKETKGCSMHQKLCQAMRKKDARE